MFYFYWQRVPESDWELAAASDFNRIVRECEPPFTTILALDHPIEESTTKEELAAIKYRGPLYFDFDAADIAQAIEAFNKFLDKLEDKGVALTQVKLYASGGKGFHCIVPQPIFLASPSSAGYQHLPAIYREMAEKLYVDTLDMRVYSGRKGRMFRTANVKRTNGRYKVPISVQEAREMTPERYVEVTSTTRPELAIDAPVFAPALALVFSQASDKVKASVGRRRSGVDVAVKAAFGGNFPPTLELIGRGEGLREGVGFQKIATQIATTATALGKSEDETVALCKGLIESHSGDGRRYDTPAKREREIRRMFRYMDGNPCYEFSAGAVKSLLSPEVAARDLDPPVEDPYGVEAETEEAEYEDSVTLGIRITQQGIFEHKFFKEQGVWKYVKLSHLGMADVAMLHDEQGSLFGFEMDLYVQGTRKRRAIVTCNAFNSSRSIQAALGSTEGVALQVSDAQAKAMIDVLRAQTKLRVKAVERVGVDYVRRLDATDENDSHEIIYVSGGPQGVLSRNPGEYKLAPREGSNPFQPDLLSAPELEATPGVLEFFDNFFTLHPPEVSGPLLGYFFASFGCQLLRARFRKFPLLQIHGLAGTGKTSFSQLLLSLHTYRRDFPEYAADGMTTYALQRYSAASASIPVIFDEAKGQEMRNYKRNELLMFMRNNYTGNGIARGRVNRASGESSVSIQTSVNAAPLVFLSEHMESQTAIVARSVCVHMTEEQKGKTGKAFDYCQNNRTVLGQWGKRAVGYLLNVDLDSLYSFVQAQIEAVRAIGDGKIAERPVYNAAVVLFGLDLAKQTLEAILLDRYESYFESYRQVILDHPQGAVPFNQSESSKVLNVLASLTSPSTGGDYTLVMGQDYMFANDPATGEACVELHLTRAWDKYARYVRSKGETPLYPGLPAFAVAVMGHRCKVDSVCIGSPLKEGRPSVRVVRLNLRRLYEEEHVEEFVNLEKEVIKMQ